MFDKNFVLNDEKYELEYSIQNNLKIYQQLLNSPELEFIKFEDEIVTTYKPVQEIQNIIFRSRKDLINQTTNVLFEKKELLYKCVEKLNNIDLKLKYSIESRTCNFEYLDVLNRERKIRLSYKHKTLNFRFDFTVRYFNFIDPIDKSQSLLKLHLSSNDVKNITKYPSFKTIFDVEIEANQANDVDFEMEYQKLVCYILNENVLLLEKLKSESFNFTKCPQVGLLTNTVLSTMNYNNFVYSDKMDGVRYLLIYYNGDVYSYQTVEKLKLREHATNFKLGLTIIDGEIIDDNYYIFDCYYFNNEDVRTEYYVSRLKHVNNELKSLKLQTLNLSLLQYSEITDFDKLIKYSQDFHEHKDGIVIHSKMPFNIIDNKFDTSVFYQYKLKPNKLNTIDFVYREIRPGVYYIYLYGTADELLFNLKNRPRYDKFSQDIYSYDSQKFNPNKKYYILFSTPYHENIFKVKYPLTNELGNLNNKICESQYDSETGTFTPIRIRSDKEYPNSYFVGLSNIALMFSPPSTHIQFKTHSDYEIMCRTYLFDRLNLEKILPESFTCLYLNSGDGYDIKNLYNIGCSNLICVDKNCENLVQCVQNSTKVFENLHIKHVLSTIDTMSKHRMTLNVIKLTEVNEFNTEIISRDEFKHGCIDLVLINNIETISNNILNAVLKFVSVDCLFVIQTNENIKIRTLECINVYEPENDSLFKNEVLKNDVENNDSEMINFTLMKFEDSF